MIIDFSTISHDYYGAVEQPTVVLKSPHGEVIAPLQVQNLKMTFRYNDVSEATFDVPAYNNNIKTAGYDELAGFRIVEIGDYGPFVLVNPSKQNEGGLKEVMSCTAYSLEYVFNFKLTGIGEGTYNFYNPLDNTDTMMGMIIEALPDWNIGHVDDELVGRWRTFEQNDDKWYSFMMSEVQKAYNCLFQFDIHNKEINAISADQTAENLPIYLSYHNLLKTVDVDELSDDVVTVLAGYGSGDDVCIRDVNPNGTDKIYNIDFFIARGDLPDDLAAKWIEYRDRLEIEQKQYGNAKSLYMERYMLYLLADAKATAYQTSYDAIDTALKTHQEAYQATSDETSRGAIQERIDDLKQQLRQRADKLHLAQLERDRLSADVDTLDEAISGMVAQLKLEAFFTPEELKILSQYFIEDTLSEDSFVISEYGSALAELLAANLVEINQVSLNVVNSALYATNRYEVVEDSQIDLQPEVQEEINEALENEQRRLVYEMRGGNMTLTFHAYDESDPESEEYTIYTITGNIVNLDLHYNTQNQVNYIDETSEDMTKQGYFVITAELLDATYNDTPYPSMHFTMSGMCDPVSGIPEITDSTLNINPQTATYVATGAATEVQRETVLNELYDYTAEQLAKLSEPSYEFTVDTANFLFAQEFEPFRNALQLGHTINLVIDKEQDTLLKPILIEIELDYGNLPSLTLTFSNKFRTSTDEFQLADIIADTTRSSRSLDLNRASYSAYRDSKVGDKVKQMRDSALDVSKNKIINATNQGMEWGPAGMFLRKSNGNGGWEDAQIGLINDSIVFTHDNWDSIDIAIGSFHDANLETDEDNGLRYGIAAPAIYGTLIAGNNLVIDNTVMSQDGTSVLKQFKVDATGAWLNNASFVLAADNGGKMLLDPRYGFAAGNANLFTVEGQDIDPSFIDENGNIIYDPDNVIVLPDGTRYYVPLNTTFYFDINTGDAYFAGVINATNIIAGTLNGMVISDGTITADKLDIDDLAALSDASGSISLAGFNVVKGTSLGRFYSGNKTTLSSSEAGIYMDTNGQAVFGNGTRYVKSYDQNGIWRVDIAADSLTIGGQAVNASSPATTNPLMDGTAAVGTSSNYARADHVHPTDTSRAPLASPALSGTPTAPTAAAGTNTQQIATTAFVKTAVDAITDNNTTYTLAQNASNGHTLTLTPSTGSATTVTIPDAPASPATLYAEETYTVHNGQIAALQSVSSSDTYSKAGYYPLSVSGWSSGDTAFTVNKAVISSRSNGSCTLDWSVVNIDSLATHTAAVQIKVLWTAIGS